MKKIFKEIGLFFKSLPLIFSKRWKEFIKDFADYLFEVKQ